MFETMWVMSADDTLVWLQQSTKMLTIILDGWAVRLWWVVKRLLNEYKRC